MACFGGIKYESYYNESDKSYNINVYSSKGEYIDGIIEVVPTLGQASSKISYITFRIVSGANIYNIRVFNQIYLLREYTECSINVVFDYFLN